MAVENFSGLVGAILTFSVDRKMLLPSSAALARLRLCPGTLRIGLSSSTSFNLAVALATPHAGVGLSSKGDEEEFESSLIMLALACGRPRKWFDRIGEIMMKSSSVCRVDGEGEGESLCLPLLVGKGDLKDDRGAAKGFGEGGTGTFVMVEVELELDPNAGAANHVVGRFSPLVRGTRKALLDEEDGSAVRCMFDEMRVRAGRD